MALEGLTTSDIEALEARLLEKVPASHAIGNKALNTSLQWEDSIYWDIRNRLIERGFLVQGKGKGGSVRRPPVVPAQSEADNSPVSAFSQSREQEEAKEKDLYEPMASVIRNRWAQEFRLDELLVEITAAGGSKPTKGKWTRPDITAASYKTYTYVPGRHFDIITFEIKPYQTLDVTVVYEALAHRRASTRAYALLHIPDEQKSSFETVIEEIEKEAKLHGVGVFIAAKPGDYDTWEELVEAERHEPDPERLNEFLTVQMSQGFRDKIIKWFK